MEQTPNWAILWMGLKAAYCGIMFAGQLQLTVGEGYDNICSIYTAGHIVIYDSA